MWRLLALLSLIAVASGHVSLVYPPSRNRDDFLNTYRVDGPCGVDRTSETPVTLIRANQQLNITWHIAYVHQGGLEINLLNNEEHYMELANLRGSNADLTREWYLVDIPNVDCTYCTIQIFSQGQEFGGAYDFYSCADVQISSDAPECPEDCSGNGNCDPETHLCECDSYHSGPACSTEHECVSDQDCSNGAACLQSECWCATGDNGDSCEASSSLEIITDEAALEEKYPRSLSNGAGSFKVYWDVDFESSEIEFFVRAKTTSWVGLGIRPAEVDLPDYCAADPYADVMMMGAPVSWPEEESYDEDFARRAQGSAGGSSSGAGSSGGSDDDGGVPTDGAGSGWLTGFTGDDDAGYGSGSGSGSGSGFFIPSLTPIFTSGSGSGSGSGMIDIITSSMISIGSGSGSGSGSNLGTVALDTGVPVTFSDGCTPVGETDDGDIICEEDCARVVDDSHLMHTMDMFIGRADGDHYFVGDYYTPARTTPLLDEARGGESHLLDYNAAQIDGMTYMVFRRPLITGDYQDWDILDGTYTVVFAFGQVYPDYDPAPWDPSSRPDFYETDILKFHGRTNRGALGNVDLLDVAVGPEPTETEVDLGFDSQQTLSDRVTLHWTLDADSSMLHFAVQAETTNYAAIGFSNSAAEMIGSQAIISWVTDGGDVAVGTYDLTAKSVSAILPVFEGETDDVFTDVSGTEVDGITTVYFSRSLSPGGGYRAIDPEADTHMIWSLGNSGDFLHQHSFTDRHSGPPTAIRFAPTGCPDGYEGDACDEPICSLDCSGHGECVAPGDCECDCAASGDCWTGDACETASCASLDDCNSNGDCVSPGECDCFDGFSGDACEVSDDAGSSLGYAGVANIISSGNTLRLHYSYDSDNDVVEFAIEGTTSGYVAFGFSPESTADSPVMPGSEGILGYVNSDGSAYLATYDLTSREGITLLATSDDDDALTLVEAYEEDRDGTVWTVVRGTRAADPADGRYAIDPDAEVFIIGSLGSADVVTYHVQRCEFPPAVAFGSAVVDNPVECNLECSGHGACYIPTDGSVQSPRCLCDANYFGSDCSESEPAQYAEVVMVVDNYNPETDEPILKAALAEYYEVPEDNVFIYAATTTGARRAGQTTLTIRIYGDDIAALEAKSASLTAEMLAEMTGLQVSSASAVIEEEPVDISTLGYDFSYAFSDGFIFHWTVSGDELAFAYELTGTGWGAAAFDSDGYMVGAEAMFGGVEASGAVFLYTYDITEKASSGLESTSPYIFNSVTGEEVNGVTVVEARRPLAPGDGFTTIDPEAKTSMIWAMHSSSDGKNEHTAKSNRGQIFEFVFATGEVTDTTTRDPLEVAHGVMMGLGWGIFLPSGVFLARYYKQKQPEGWWFRMHQNCQRFGLLMVTIGFILALVMVDGEHVFDKPHGSLGLFVMLAGYSQAIGAIFRPHPGTDYRWIFNWLHWSIGRTAIVLGIVNVFLGLGETNASDALTGVFAAWVAVYALATLVKEFFLRTSDDGDKAVANHSQMQSLNDIEMESRVNLA